MTNDVKLPRKLSDEPAAPKPRRPSHARVIDQLDRWANSPGLQPPRVNDEDDSKAETF
ncbi:MULTISPECIES: hypothetical protein [Bradyrhizobium]|mgnify:CR=1 FL=1|jgi:hypothetical protein|uniref:hypothetical protein n=1 Tax=Bradyrhizobium TaxID=374 RepID=UPI0004284274|nr:MULTISPECIES: hypothetical protein [Bradyrhizobium]